MIRSAGGARAAVDLPVPCVDALAHSTRVRDAIVRDIAAAGGWISFARYMELALYAPGLGYYRAGATKFGGSGDFVPAPEISSLFGRTLARQVAQLLDRRGGDILEVGAGSGRLAIDLLCELVRLDALPQRYAILEVSGDLRERQRALLSVKVPELLPRVCWIDTLPQSFTGVVVGNEVLDAMPVHLVCWRDGSSVERGVAIDHGAFVWAERPIACAELRDAAAAISPGDDYLSEVSLAAPAFVATTGRSIERGAAIFIDYGFGRTEYYHPQRNRGTLMCHFRHRAHDDPFHLPGLQDITSHVDFDAIAEAAVGAGMAVRDYGSQARFSGPARITELLAETGPTDVGRRLA